MTEVDDLRGEIERLRAMLWDNDIDPDPAPPEPEQFGPPTYFVYQMQRLFKAAAAAHAKEEVRRVEDMIFASGKQWPSSLRIRLPTDFTVQLKRDT